MSERRLELTSLKWTRGGLGQDVLLGWAIAGGNVQRATIFPSRSFNAVLSSIASANGRFSSAFSASEARSRFVDLSVPRRERQGESVSGTGTVMEATKIRLEAVASLPGTDGSNPFPSSKESANFQFLCAQ